MYKLMDKVSIIIPTYNRFNFLLNTITSVKEQTYKNIEIIVINDCSTQKEYYDYQFDNDIIIINLKENSKKIFGFACANYVRNEGIKISTGKYIAFCDDDDIWFPSKLELQIKFMNETKCKMSCTEGLIGSGIYNDNLSYKKYNSDHYFNILKNIYRKHGYYILENGFPKIWDLKFLKIHNCCITSSVIVDKNILVKYDCVKNEPNGTADDYRIWLRAMEYTNCVYVDDICFYYDDGHGNGQDY